MVEQPSGLLGVQGGCPGAQSGCPGVQGGCPSVQRGCPGVQSGCPGLQDGCPGAQAGCPGAQAGCPGAQGAVQVHRRAVRALWGGWAVLPSVQGVWRPAGVSWVVGWTLQARFWAAQARWTAVLGVVGADLGAAGGAPCNFEGPISYQAGRAPHVGPAFCFGRAHGR